MVAAALAPRLRRGLRLVARPLTAVLPDRLVTRLRETPAGRLLGSSGPAPGQPTFSIVIPLYDSPVDHLRSQLTSIAAQTYPHWECILVDDGSPTPFAADLADEFAATDARYRVIRRSSNGGIAAATNTGLDAVRHDWVVFSDHDDRLRPSALAAIATHLVEHPDDDVVYTDECLIDEDGEELVVYRKPDFSPHRFRAMNYFCHIVTMRATLVADIGRLDPDMEPSADRDFNLRASERARSIGHIPDILYEWRAIEGSVAMDLDQKAGVKESTLAGAAAHLDRTGSSGRAVPAPHQPYLIRVERPRPAGTIATLTWDEHTTFDELAQLARAADGDLLVLHHRSITVDDRIAPLEALAAEPDVGAAAPRLVADGRLVSGGHLHFPSLMEIAPGVELDDPGPWGVYQVDHEVAGVEPDLVVFDRSALLDAGGFDLHALGLPSTLPDDAQAALRGEFAMTYLVGIVCTRLWQRSTPAVWSPLVDVEVDPARLGWTRNLRRRAGWRHLAEVVPELRHDPFSPIEIRR